MSDRIQHRIAKSAADAVSAMSQKGDKEKSEYKSFCEGLPALLRNAGLLQTMAFLQAKDKHPHSTVLNELTAQLKSLGLWDGLGEITVRIAALPSPDYMTWTRVIEQVVYWHKRFAQALLKAKEKK